MGFRPSLTIPPLNIPIESRSNPQIELAKTTTWKWVRTFDLIYSNAAHKEFTAAQIWDLVARNYPDASADDLCLICDWQVFMHIQSEQFAEARPGRSARRHQAYVDEAIKLMREPRLAMARNDGVLLAALSQLWTRTHARLGPEMADRFISTFDSYLTGYLSSSENRRLGYLPTYSEYVGMRRNTSGFRLLALFTEMALGQELPKHIREHHTVAGLLGHANDAVSWMHDIYRMERFSSRNDTHHLIEVVRQERNLLPQEAMNVVGRHINDSVGSFVAQRLTVPKFDEPCEAYIAGIASLIRGMYDWLRVHGWLDGSHSARGGEQQG